MSRRKRMLKDVPRVRMIVPRKVVASRSTKAFNRDKEHRLRYEVKEHAKQPHVLKFSGGRSSGMLLFLLLKNSILKPERGDVIVFNNTSAEHPATYEFVRECKQIAEEQYGVPFFWIEFQTYEDVSKGRWTRLPGYRMVKPTPYSSDSPDGYHWRGEVFEEIMSWKGHVPNVFKRTCTATMKLLITQEFLRDWFALKDGIGRLGHFGKEGSRVDDDDLFEIHQRNRGDTPREVLLEKKQYLRGRPTARPEQKFADFSDAITTPIVNSKLVGRAAGGRVDFSGRDCVEYLAFVGFRNDEPKRVANMRERNNGTPMDQSVGEYVYAPLASLGVGREDVLEFWNRQSIELLLPDSVNLSNCVFCFLKGAPAIAELVSRQRQVDSSLPPELRSVPDTPSDIHWWIKMEHKYGRDLLREERKVRAKKNVASSNSERPIIGFFGFGRQNYETLSRKGEQLRGTGNQRQEGLFALMEQGALPCDCTD